MGILDPRLAVKPFEYDWAIRYWRDVHSSHWLPEEISMTEDVQDFHTKLTAAERWVSGGTLKGFTQTEVLIGDFWTKICHWIPKPEIIMMAMSFAAWESIHIMAYSIMNDSLGLNDYEAFLQDPMCKAKLERLMGAGLDSRSRTQGKLIASLQELRGRLLSGSFDGDRDAAVVSQTLEHLSIPAADQAATPEEIARAIAIFSAFGEGVSLFSSFAVLLNFTRMPRNCLRAWASRLATQSATSLCIQRPVAASSTPLLLTIQTYSVPVSKTTFARPPISRLSWSQTLLRDCLWTAP